jgi:outer membrane immunogenic protein
MASYSYDYAAFAMTGSTTTRTLPNPISMKGTYMGWTLGGGIEHAMTSNIVLRAEFNYRDFGTETFDTPYGQHRIDLTSSEWKLGAAYKF